LDILGVMLPATPLHHLLFHRPETPAAVVMTSGNRSGEPICIGNDEGLKRLHGLADFFLLHDREIVTRVDDSVARIMAGKVRLLRRARGYSPVPVPLRSDRGYSGLWRGDEKQLLYRPEPGGLPQSAHR
jgi:hydrogenase maturation protein HypF